MDSLLDFTNKTAIITGAANGFGMRLAIELNKRGCSFWRFGTVGAHVTFINR